MAGMSGRSADGPESVGARARESCSRVCAYCVKHLSYGPEPALGTPASAGRPYACASAIGGEGAEGRRAEGRKPKAAGLPGR